MRNRKLFPINSRNNFRGNEKFYFAYTSLQREGLKDSGKPDPCALILPEGDFRYNWVSFSPGMKICCAEL